jgi:hypothetical protein
LNIRDYDILTRKRVLQSDLRSLTHPFSFTDIVIIIKKDEFGMTPFLGRGMGKEEAAVCHFKLVFFKFPRGKPPLLPSLCDLKNNVIPNPYTGQNSKNW